VWEIVLREARSRAAREAMVNWMDAASPLVMDVLGPLVLPHFESVIKHNHIPISSIQLNPLSYKIPLTLSHFTINQ
jgi:hypothetical protein